VVDRIDLMREYGVDAQRRWRNKGTAAANMTFVTFGKLADGRWYANRSDDKAGAYVFSADELGHTLALRLAYRWMRNEGGRWWATPASYGPGGTEPADGLPWVRRGGEWHLEQE
jgi:hypothetical protein